MFNVKWDSQINGIKLTTDDSDLIPPRPVFYEELNLIGFDKFWKYPKTENHLLWAIGRRYFYNGMHVATANKGNALELPKIDVVDDFKDLEIEPVDIEEVIKRNEKELFVLENNAIDFVEEISDNYSNYPFSVSFSGGKDSQAVLDLITRVIPSNEITVIFSDTTLEHDYTYSTVKDTISLYKKQYPTLSFNISKPPKSAKELFKSMGLPSRFHRWCTPVLKTAPYNKLINSLVDDNKIIVFEGVRLEESTLRSKYRQIADGVKHPAIINCRPILYWNFSEVVLYNFYRKLPMNKLYRYGLSRVGCKLCPFSSQWSECIYGHLDNKFKDEYIPLIKEYANNRNVKSEKKINDFISNGHWKKRAGGKGLKSDTSIEFSIGKKSFKSISINPNENFLEWVKTLGDVVFEEKNGKVFGELNIDNEFIKFQLVNKDNKQIIEFFDIQGNIKIINKLKRVLKKSTFCTHCGVCDVECTKGAIQTNAIVHINSDLCNYCENCFKFTAHGCYRARSIYAGSGGQNMNKKTTGIDRYSSFGLREEWLDEFFEYGDNWLENNGLGTKQVMAVKNWLIDAQLIDSNKKLTNLGSNLREIYKKDSNFVWGVIWVNLYYNSKVINWYCDTINWGRILSKNDLLEFIKETYDLSEGTLKNAIDAMINTFKTSPLGDSFKLGILKLKGRRVKSVKKRGVIGDLDKLLVAYSLYKLVESKSRFDFTVSELYDENLSEGPYNLFGVSKKSLERALRGLHQSNENIVKVDLAKDLDNIFLNKDITSEDIINFKKGGL